MKREQNKACVGYNSVQAMTIKTTFLFSAVFRGQDRALSSV